VYTVRYIKLDKSQPFNPNSDEIIKEFNQRMISNGDIDDVLWQMQKRGSSNIQGQSLPSIEGLLQHIQKQKLKLLSRYNLDSVMDNIHQTLRDIINIERQGISKLLEDIRQRTEFQPGELTPELQQKLYKSMEEKAFRNRNKLDNLSPDAAGKIKDLSQYDFWNEDAKLRFQDLLNMLKKMTLDTYTRELVQSLQSIDPSTINRIQEMLQALNPMLEAKRKGQNPDFDGFKERFGHLFGPHPPANLEELIHQLRDQIDRTQSLLNSLSREQRQELEDILKSVLNSQTLLELTRLNINLNYLTHISDSQERYTFFGDESVSYSEALKLIDNLQKMDKLENQFNDLLYNRSLGSIDPEMVQEILGPESVSQLNTIKNITRTLEDAGYIRLDGHAYKLTPYGVRKIGEKALSSVFVNLKKDHRGGHRISDPGGGGERVFDTKKYEFGDDFDINIEKTIINALLRNPQYPVKLDIGDFEIFKEEHLTRSATVLMLDLSLSMHMHGNFQAAKIVALALDTLIRSQFPRDSLYIVGFSSYARSITREDLSSINWDNLDPYPNMQHGLSLARKLLNKDTSANKHILLVSDGEPTAHFENSRVFFQYPPSSRTLQLTLKEVKACTRCGIIINTFMLRSGGFSGAFIDQVTRLNRGRVFFTSSSNLGQYLIVDYLSNKKINIS
jgi:uncharacterized protein with von Willebrand factor type A (vWA) domain